MKRLLSALIIIASAIGSTVLKSKGHTKSAILTLILGAGAAGGVMYLTSWAAELTEIPTNFTAGDFGFLNSSITTTATTITVSPITKWVNGTKTTGCFDSGSGFVLMQDGAGRTEYASYGAKSCASNVTSLTDVRRGLNPTGSSFDAGTGLSFAASTSIRVVNWPGLFNNAVYKIQRNTMTGSGKTICNTTRQTCFNVGTASAAVRNAMNVETGDMIYNSTSGTAEFYNGTNWIQFGSGSVINATETQDGKVSIAGTGAMLTGSGQGINGAIDVISAKYLTTSGGNVLHAGYIPVIENSGYLSGTLLGSTPTATTYLRGDMTYVDPTSAFISTKMFGDAGSGAITVSVTRPFNAATQHNFSTFTLNVSTTIGLTASNATLILKATGDVTINGTIDLNGDGAAGGAGGTKCTGEPCDASNGSSGSAGASLVSGWTGAGGTLGQGGNGSSVGASAIHGGGGGGGSSVVTDGAAGSTGSNSAAGGAGGTKIDANQLAFIQQLFEGVVCGAGGAGGGGGSRSAGGPANTTDGATGGSGGGCSVFYIGGDLTLGASSIIRANGSAGSNAANDSSGDGGGGGGGAGGSIVIIVGGSITDGGVTLTATAGAGGTSGSSAGGAGGAGKVLIYSIETGTLISS